MISTCTWLIISAVMALSGSTYTDAKNTKPSVDVGGFWLPGKNQGNNHERKRDRINPFQMEAERLRRSDNTDWQADYYEPLDGGVVPDVDYLYGLEVVAPPMRKRVAVSPFISLDAFNNLPQFFEQLKESLENQDHHNAQQQQQIATADNYNYRPPATAAVLNAFRQHAGYRRTRSYPYPALVQG